jgi:GNAT superfamily N-acetyltransferase
MPSEKTEALEIRQVSQLSPEEAHQLWGWSDDIFGTAGLNLTYRSKDGVVRFVLSTGGEAAVSHAAVLKHQAAANGSAARIGGIGGVVTIPAMQRRGYAELLVRHATKFLHDQWAVDFGLLFCIDRMVPYYERLGWRKVTCDVLIDQPSGKMPCPLHVMTMAFNPTFESIDSIELNSGPW